MFDTDPCSPMEVEDFNVPARLRYTEETDGLAHSWGLPGQDVFLNPPYSEYTLWVNKAIQEAHRGLYVWALLNQSNSQYWQDVINPNMIFKIAVRGRVAFVKDGVIEPHPRYDNYLVHFGPDSYHLLKLFSNPSNFPIKGELITPPIRVGFMPDAQRSA